MKTLLLLNYPMFTLFIMKLKQLLLSLYFLNKSFSAKNADNGSISQANTSIISVFNLDLFRINSFFTLGLLGFKYKNLFEQTRIFRI